MNEDRWARLIVTVKQWEERAGELICAMWPRPDLRPDDHPDGPDPRLAEMDSAFPMMDPERRRSLAFLTNHPQLRGFEPCFEKLREDQKLELARFVWDFWRDSGLQGLITEDDTKTADEDIRAHWKRRLAADAIRSKTLDYGPLWDHERDCPRYDDVELLVLDGVRYTTDPATGQLRADEASYRDAWVILVNGEPATIGEWGIAEGSRDGVHYYDVSGTVLYRRFAAEAPDLSPEKIESETLKLRSRKKGRLGAEASRLLDHIIGEYDRGGSDEDLAVWLRKAWGIVIDPSNLSRRAKR